MVTNQNRLFAYLGFLLYFHKSHNLQLHIEFQNVQNILFRNYLSYIMLEHEKNMWKNSENRKFVGSSQQLNRLRHPTSAVPRTSSLADVLKWI